MFRHIWHNRNLLCLNPQAFTQITSVRPCLRVSPLDGFQIRETVVECTQYLKLTRPELEAYGLRPPKDLPSGGRVVLEGGSTLILDEYGELKYEVSNRLPSPPSSEDSPWHRGRFLRRWQRRIDYMGECGYLNRSSLLPAFHRQRMGGAALPFRQQLDMKRRRGEEGWR